MRFDDNRLLPLLFGPNNQWLGMIEKTCGVFLTHHGNYIGISGEHDACHAAQATLKTLYHQAEQGIIIDIGHIQQALAQCLVELNLQEADRLAATISIGSRNITARNANQTAYVRAMQEKTIIFASGAAGTGKTWLAVFFGVFLLKAGLVKKIVLTRPVVEAGERLGFLPGDLHDKIDPYLQPVYDAFDQALGHDTFKRYMERGVIEIVPLAFMRGRTLKNAFILLDEAQNASKAQMKMFLTRLGENSHMVITGDPSQSDLYDGGISGFSDALARFGKHSHIGLVRFDDKDVVRHGLVAEILRAYDKDEDA